MGSSVPSSPMISELPLASCAVIVTPLDSRIGSRAGSPSGGVTDVKAV